MNTGDMVAVIGYYDGSAGQIEEWFEEATGMRIACFVIDDDNFIYPDIVTENNKRTCKTTDFPGNGSFKGYPLITTSDWVAVLAEMNISKVICLNPDNRKRANNIETARKAGMQLVSAIHPSVIILNKAIIAEGVWINAGSIIGYKAEIKEGVLINTGVQIDHHNVLKNCCQIDPGVVTAGNVVIGERSNVHTGAVVINRIEIGADAIIGAGAVVIKNIPPDCTAVGIPAKVIKDHNR